ncbi:MAG: lipoprotein NlpI [Methanoregulaceae archaeon PtaB.Bin152]|nr:MAG: lipoprotein NlpI [Methanoregulaceae archaeon PtaB.Bin152]
MNCRVLLFIAACSVVALVTCGAAAPAMEAIDAYNNGVDLAVEGNFPAALESIDKALSIDPNFTLAWITRAGILNAMGEYNQSLVASDRALAIDEKQAEAWTNRASALISLGRDEEALEAADRAIELDPRLSKAWIDRSTALSNLGRNDEANEAIQMAMFLIGEMNESPGPEPTTAKAPLSWILASAALGVATGFILTKRELV